MGARRNLALVAHQRGHNRRLHRRWLLARRHRARSLVAHVDRMVHGLLRGHVDLRLRLVKFGGASLHFIEDEVLVVHQHVGTVLLLVLLGLGRINVRTHLASDRDRPVGDLVRSVLLLLLLLVVAGHHGGRVTLLICWCVVRRSFSVQGDARAHDDPGVACRTGRVRIASDPRRLELRGHGVLVHRLC